MKVESPCISICRLKNGICIGCFRSSKEITKWWDATIEEKIEILQNAQQRKNDFESA